MRLFEIPTVVRSWGARPTRVRWARAVLLTLSFLPYLTAADHIHGDVRLYHEAAMRLLGGERPYLDFAFGYPPLALLWFLPPVAIAGESVEVFWYAFMVEMALFDLWIKLLLLREGSRLSSGWRSLVPFAVYSASCAFLRFHFLQRYDLVPAALTLAGLVFLGRGRWFRSGLVLALAAGTKLYPLVLLVPVAALAARRGGFRYYAIGVAAGAGPLLALGPFVPWWEFLSLHAGRGLQVESLYASVLWLLNGYDLVSVRWERVANYYEVHGSTAKMVLAWARPTFLVLTLASMAAATWRLGRVSDVDSVGLSRILLVPLLAFVVFNTVLSPQYLVWLAPLVGLAAWRGPAELFMGFILVTASTSLVFPSPEYETGLNRLQAHVLVLRNFWLVAGWCVGVVALLRCGRTNHARPRQP